MAAGASGANASCNPFFVGARPLNDTRLAVLDVAVSMGFEKVVIARPSHLLGKRKDEKISFLISALEIITNLLGHLMIGPLKKYRNIHASNVASSLVSKMNDIEDGIHMLDFNDFKNR